MATRQYIGARYVPKFFEYNNGEWQENTQYEPLTIVQYQGNSYTSKKEVPANIGDPSHNSDYWVSTGNYNAQVELLREELIATEENLSDEIINRQNGDTNLNNLINARTIPSQRKFVFIGDSYNTSTHHGGWASMVKSLMGLTERTNAFTGAVGGACFGNTENSFLSILQSIAGNMTSDQKESITDVVIQGDVNDWSRDASTIGAGVQQCDSYVVNNFPNARYWIILASWSYELSNIRQGTLSAYNAIYEYNKHACIIKDAFKLFCCPSFLENDKTHPTENGMYNLACSIVSVLNGGDTYLKQYSDLNATFNDGTNSIVINGSFTESGLHIWRSSLVGWGGNLVTIGNYANPLTLGTTTNNNLFERPKAFQAHALLNINNSDHFVETTLGVNVVLNNNNTWSLQVYSQSIVQGESDWAIHNVSGIYLTLDTTFDYWNN